MAVSSVDLLMGFSKPSEDEETYYFDGLAGSPRLIAKTSTTPWETHTDINSRSKRISTVGDHHPVHKWCPELRTGIVRALSNPGVNWDCFYPIRIGYDENSANAVVLLVCLRAPRQGPHPWEPAMLAALRCRTLLHSYHIYDIEVEMKQSEFVPMASSAAALVSSIDWTYSQVLPIANSRDRGMAEINGKVMALLPFPGCRVEQEEGRRSEPKAEAGTMGLYLRLAHTEQSALPGTIYGLTSRHVAVGKRVPIYQDLRWPSNDIGHDNEPSLRILTGGPSCVNKASAGLNYAGRVWRAHLRNTEVPYFKNPDDAHTSELYHMHNASIAYVDKLREALNEVEEADTSQRVLGTVAYSPGHGIGSHGNFKDWALVQMVDAGQDGPSPYREYTDKVYMAGYSADVMIHAEALADPDSQDDSVTLNLDANGFLQLHGRDIPPQPPFACDDRTSHLEAKRGQTTGLRFGIINEIEAVRHTPFGKGQSLVSYHLLVLDFVGGHFSQPGDSGSSVFDWTGRVMGILDGGERVKNVVRYMKKYHLDTGAGLPDVSDVPSQESLPEGFAQLTASAILGLDEPIEPLEDAMPGEDPSPDVTFVIKYQGLPLQHKKDVSNMHASLVKYNAPNSRPNLGRRERRCQHLWYIEVSIASIEVPAV